jgi:hypothetical protein
MNTPREANARPSATQFAEQSQRPGFRNGEWLSTMPALAPAPKPIAVGWRRRQTRAQGP